MGSCADKLERALAIDPDSLEAQQQSYADGAGEYFEEDGEEVYYGDETQYEPVSTDTTQPAWPVPGAESMSYRRSHTPSVAVGSDPELGVVHPRSE